MDKRGCLTIVCVFVMLANASEIVYEMSVRFRNLCRTRFDIRNGKPMDEHERRTMIQDLFFAATKGAFRNRSVTASRVVDRDMMDFRFHASFLWDEPESWNWLYQTVCTILYYYIEFGSIEDKTVCPLLFWDDGLLYFCLCNKVYVIFVLGSFQTCFDDVDQPVIPIGHWEYVRVPPRRCDFVMWEKVVIGKRKKFRYKIHPEEHRCVFLDHTEGLPWNGDLESEDLENSDDTNQGTEL